MWAKLLIGAAAGFFFAVAGFVVGWVVGADVGGNSMVDFEFAGMRGYEATGLIGGGIGAAFGGLLGVVLVLLVSSRRGSR